MQRAAMTKRAGGVRARLTALGITGVLLGGVLVGGPQVDAQVVRPEVPPPPPGVKVEIGKPIGDGVVPLGTAAVKRAEPEVPTGSFTAYPHEISRVETGLDDVPRLPWLSERVRGGGGAVVRTEETGVRPPGVVDRGILPPSGPPAKGTVDPARMLPYKTLAAPPEPVFREFPGCKGDVAPGKLGEVTRSVAGLSALQKAKLCGSAEDRTRAAAATPLSSSTPGDEGVEVPAERGASWKVYQMPDGAKRVRVWPVPIHEKQADGSFGVVDPTLRADASGVKGKGIGFVSSFGDQAKADVLVAMDTAAGGRIAFRADGAAGVPAKVVANKVTYPNAWPGVDLVYEQRLSDVKETLVLSRRTVATSYRFPFTLSRGLSARAAKDGGVEFVDGAGAVVAAVPVPFVADSAGELAKDAKTVSVSIDGDALVLKVDQGWLDAPGRVFPVLLDPRVFVGGNGGCTPGINDCPGSWDTQVVSGDTANMNFEGTTSLRWGGVGGSFARGYFFYDLHAINQKVVRSARWSPYVMNGTNVSGSNYKLVPMASYGDWSTGLITWNNQPGGVISRAVDGGLNQFGWNNLDILALAQYWAQHGIGSNGGFSIRSVNAQGVEDPGISVEVATSENFGYQPTIDIEYYDVPPPTPTLMSPVSNSTLSAVTVGTTTPKLTIAGNSGLPWFRVATDRNMNNIVVNSGWRTTGVNDWTVPAGVLRDGVTSTGRCGRRPTRPRAGRQVWLSVSRSIFVRGYRRSRRWTRCGR